MQEIPAYTHRQLQYYTHRYEYKKDCIDIVTKNILKVLLQMVPCMECKYCTGKRQIFFHELLSFCQTFVSICFSFSQEFVCSIRSQSMLISLVSILQSDSQSDWSICSSVVSPWGTLLPFGDKRKCASEFSTPAFPAHVTFSLAWRIQLSHCCLLKESLAWSE